MKLFPAGSRSGLQRHADRVAWGRARQICCGNPWTVSSCSTRLYVRPSPGARHVKTQPSRPSHRTGGAGPFRFRTLGAQAARFTSGSRGQCGSWRRLPASQPARSDAATRTRRLKTSGKVQTTDRSLVCHVGAGRSTGHRMASGASPESEPVAALAAIGTSTRCRASAAVAPSAASAAMSTDGQGSAASRAIRPRSGSAGQGPAAYADVTGIPGKRLAVRGRGVRPLRAWRTRSPCRTERRRSPAARPGRASAYHLHSRPAPTVPPSADGSAQACTVASSA